MANAEVMVVGSANMDLVFRTARFPAPGETISGDSFATFPGGKGANQAVAAGKLGATVRFVGKVGNDAFGTSLDESLCAAGVDTSHLMRSADQPTGVAAILVDATGQNAIVVAAGANQALLTSDLADTVRSTSAAVVLAQLESPIETICDLPSLLPEGTIFILNPAPARTVPAALLEKIDLITPNETETFALTGIMPNDDASCATAAAKLLDAGVKNVVITLGARGCYYANADGGKVFPTITVKPVDTTAAGDAFNGALATFLAEGMTYAEAIPLANRVGALSTTKAGAQASMPTRQELDALVNV